MELKISFFARDLIDAIGAGIYQVSIQYQDGEEALYIGESIFVLMRCAAHLFDLKKDPGYFGFTAQTIPNPDITLHFTLLQTCDDPIQRKKLEKIYQDHHPPNCKAESVTG